ncbi:MAG: NUDIX domain-containing protein [Litorilinea sp.]
MRISECVVFLIVRDGCVLVERRKLSKLLLPGVIAIPGGGIEADETPLAATRREVFEELNLVVADAQPICTLLDRTGLEEIGEARRLHYFWISEWSGEFQVHEADEILWVRLDELAQLILHVDRLAITEYLRLYHH